MLDGKTIVARENKAVTLLMLTVLGIETSCDETAASVVQRTDDGSGRIMANIVLSQTDEHALYGGVVPEVAARGHIAHLDGLIEKAIAVAGVTYEALDGIAATAGPGLLGGLLVGLTTGKAIALAYNKPLIAVNHLEGHALTPRLLGACPFPYLLLLVSGGHTQFQLVEDVGRYVRIGTTIDDALGEAFDKVAKLLGLCYPGGPQVEREARMGDAGRFDFPRPLLGRRDCNFSFSGLKTAVREEIHRLGELSSQDTADICASFQRAVAETIADRLKMAFAMFQASHPLIAKPTLVVAGGVAANARLKQVIEREAHGAGFRLVVPPAALCTDNAAMIAWAGAERLRMGLHDDLGFKARPRWPLDNTSNAIVGSGKAGPKV